MKKAIFSALMLSALALTACSDEKFVGDPKKDLSTTTEMLTPKEETVFSTYWQRENGRVGDPMPFYDPKAKEFKILYLHETDKNDAKCFHPFYALTTADGANYENIGEVLPCGKSGREEDAALGTGCCVYNEADNLYYIYYTGHTDKEVVMRATSPDFKNFTKDYTWVLRPEKFGLSTKDFRDPQIFKIGNEYHMLIAARENNDGMFAEFKSANMKDWEFVGTFHMLWDRMYECPDVFQMGDWWYLVYSDSPAWERTVKYVKAKSWDELKKLFTNDGGFDYYQSFMKLDGRAFYAGKTASDGTNRYIWGWCPTRPDGNNANVGNGEKEADGTEQKNEPEWSGALVCHKLAQEADGSLYLTAVPGMAEKYNKPAEIKVMKEGEGFTLYNRLGTHNHISFTVKLAKEDDAFGLSFGRGDGNDKFVTLRLNNPHWDADKHDLRRTEFYVGDKFINGADGKFYPRSEDNTYNVDIYTDNSVVVMYVNGTGCLTSRIYGLQNNCWSINNYGNKIEVSNLKVTQY